MKIAIFCRNEPRHIYFANALIKRFPIDRVFVEEKSSIYMKQRLRNEAFFFFKNKEPAFLKEELLRRTSDINDGVVNEYLAKAGNLLVCVFGCSIIKMEKAFDKNVRMVNLHSGIVPQYRGVHCVFWALYNKEPDLVGCSIHLLNRRIDNGDILVQAFPGISADDNEETLFNKTIKLGVGEFIKAIDFFRSNRRVKFKPQSGYGRIYFSRKRTAAKERRLESMLKQGLLHNFHTSERVNRYYEKH